MKDIAASIAYADLQVGDEIVVRIPRAAGGHEFMMVTVYLILSSLPDGIVYMWLDASRGSSRFGQPDVYRIRYDRHIAPRDAFLTVRSGELTLNRRES